MQSQASPAPTSITHLAANEKNVAVPWWTACQNKVTYATNYPTVFKGDFQEVLIPLAWNMLRGIFFGSLAAKVYPDRKRKGLRVARERGDVASDMDMRHGDIIHEVQAGETLGDIAKKYTGQLMNYKKS